MVRCSSSIAQPSVTALSPSRRSSIESDGDVWAKCSVWPASWKSARQSSGPPCGLITRMTRPGISIGDAERARVLVRPLLEVELDVLLRAQVDAEVGERRLERRQHPVAPGTPSPSSRRARRAPTSQRSTSPSPSADARAEEPVARLLPQVLGDGEEAPALLREVVEREAEARGRGRRSCRRRAAGSRAGRPRPRCSSSGVQVLLGELVPRRLDPLAAVAVVLVHQPRPEHPVRDLLAVDRRRQRRLELGDALRLLAHEVAEVARARELPQLARAAVPVDRGAERERRVELRQALVPLVDRRELVASPSGPRSGGTTPRRARR